MKLYRATTPDGSPRCIVVTEEGIVYPFVSEDAARIGLRSNLECYWPAHFVVPPFTFYTLGEELPLTLPPKED